ncbi:MAG: 4'-phosphopantetheinyl transferase family protein [Flavobacteriales bacterium]
MPLYKTITVNNHTKVLIWNILEPFNELSKGIKLTNHCNQRVQKMKSDLHKRGFMSIRHLLAIEGYSDFDLYYDQDGKPHLKDGKEISITHSFTFSAIIISDKKVGIDIEKQRPKILKIAHKFTPLQEYRTLANDEALIQKLTIVWGAKEALYKSFANKGISFLQNIDVDDFSLTNTKTSATVFYLGNTEKYAISFLDFEGFTCVYALINNHE